jgi:predicted DNA-binding transcriptional regulator AlpA
VIPARTAAADAAKFLTRLELCRRWRISRSTSYRLERTGFLRPPLRLGPGIARWALSEIEMIEARAAEDRRGRAG